MFVKGQLLIGAERVMHPYSQGHSDTHRLAGGCKGVHSLENTAKIKPKGINIVLTKLFKGKSVNFAVPTTIFS
jgi:hypothetical protein